MSLVTTTGRYCFIKCDSPYCTKKIEHVDPEQAKQLAGMCDWKKRGNQWICPDCAARLSEKAPPRKKKGRSGPRREEPSLAR